MKTNQINLVKDSFYLIAKIPTETIGELFYNRLFEIAPEIRPIFSRIDISKQSQKLTLTLAYIVKRLDNLEAIKGGIVRFSQGHVRYGIVEPKLYEPVGDALLWTLEQGLGSNWNRNIKNA